MASDARERHARFLVLGGGVSGLAAAAALGEGACVLDPNPAGYKVGESVIPEQFHDPRMAALLPAVRALPSWSPKGGTLFVHGREAGFFPLRQHHERAMHVMRHELEATMARELGVEVVRERVVEVDPAGRRVRTEAGWWRSEAPLIDCSGPAMLMAQATGSVEDLWPVSASWAYFDVEPVGREAFWQAARAANWRATALDVPSGRLLEEPEGRADPASLTALVRVDDGLWLWQIPLYQHRLLSVGVVSRRGALDQASFEALVREHLLPAWRAESRIGRAAEACARPGGVTPPPETRRFHQRSGFARRAARAASEDWILIGDAFAFADPVYSVGTGLAVNQALQVADRLRRNGWSADAAERYHDASEAAFARAVEAFGFWYDGRVMRDQEIASRVQAEFLAGESFRGSAFSTYTAVIRGAMAATDRGVVDLVDDALAALALSFEVSTSPHEGRIALRCDTPRVDLSVERRREGSRALTWIGDLGLSYQTDRGGLGGQVAIEVLGQLREVVAAAPEPWLAALERVEAMRPR